MRLIVLALLLLAGCASQPGGLAPPDSGRLVLLAPLTIPAESASVRLQYGKPVARNGVREYDPFCVFEIETVSDAPQIVRPDTFRITRIGHSIGGIADTVAAPAYPAPIKVGLSRDGRPTHIYYKTLFWLRSDTRPGARLLNCMSNQNLPGVYPFMRHLTLPEIREALGPDFRLETR
jgi:hypothetical protein